MVGFFIGKIFYGVTRSDTVTPILLEGVFNVFSFNPPYKLGVLDHFLINSRDYVNYSKTKIQAKRKKAKKTNKVRFSGVKSTLEIVDYILLLMLRRSSSHSSQMISQFAPYGRSVSKS